MLGSGLDHKVHKDKQCLYLQPKNTTTTHFQVASINSVTKNQNDVDIALFSGVCSAPFCWQKEQLIHKENNNKTKNQTTWF